MIPLIVGLFTAVSLGWMRFGNAIKGKLRNSVTASNSGGGAFINEDDDPEDWPIVSLPNGEKWQVAPSYIGPIGINEAAALVKKHGFELPTPALVDAIWRQADIQLTPLPRNNVISTAVFEDQKRRITEQLDGRNYILLGGIFKDVVQVNGHPEIYGWHVKDAEVIPFLGTDFKFSKTVTPGGGKVIQPMSGRAHDLPGPIGFKDYSQGVRFVRRVG